MTMNDIYSIIRYGADKAINARETSDLSDSLERRGVPEKSFFLCIVGVLACVLLGCGPDNSGSDAMANGEAEATALATAKSSSFICNVGECWCEWGDKNPDSDLSCEGMDKVCGAVGSTITCRKGEYCSCDFPPASFEVVQSTQQEVLASLNGSESVPPEAYLERRLSSFRRTPHTMTGSIDFKCKQGTCECDTDAPEMDEMSCAGMDTACEAFGKTPECTFKPPYKSGHCTCEV